MKKILIALSAIIILILASSAYACGCASAKADINIDSSVTGYAAQGIHEPGTGIENPELKQQGTGQGLQQNTSAGEKAMNQTQIQNQTGIQQQARKRARVHVEEMIQQKQQQMNQQLQNMNNKTKNIYQNQNKIRLAVHAFLAMENLTGGIGPQVSAIAREFNNSVQSTLRLEQRIQNRSRFSRFFAGGDNEAGQQLEQQINQSRQRLKELQQHKDKCPCDNETRAMMQEQIQLMQNETTRLQLLAQKEQKSKGLFGWLWK